MMLWLIWLTMMFFIGVYLLECAEMQKKAERIAAALEQIEHNGRRA